MATRITATVMPQRCLEGHCQAWALDSPVGCGDPWKQVVCRAAAAVPKMEPLLPCSLCVSSARIQPSGQLPLTC